MRYGKLWVNGKEKGLVYGNLWAPGEEKRLILALNDTGAGTSPKRLIEEAVRAFGYSTGKLLVMKKDDNGSHYFQVFGPNTATVYELKKEFPVDFECEWYIITPIKDIR